MVQQHQLTFDYCGVTSKKYNAQIKVHLSFSFLGSSQIVKLFIINWEVYKSGYNQTLPPSSTVYDHKDCLHQNVYASDTPGSIT